MYMLMGGQVNLHVGSLERVSEEVDLVGGGSDGLSD